jgi:hypothetical protein
MLDVCAVSFVAWVGGLMPALGDRLARSESPVAEAVDRWDEPIEIPHGQHRRHLSRFIFARSALLNALADAPCRRFGIGTR